MKAQEWLERSQAAEDPIDRFSNIWRAFNNLYFSVDRQYEREKIRSYLAERIDDKHATALLADYGTEINNLLEQPVMDMRGNGRDTSHYIEAFHATDHSAHKVKELFMIIYQIRCNLEHGQKSPSRKRDVELCRSAGRLVYRVVEANV